MMKKTFLFSTKSHFIQEILICISLNDFNTCGTRRSWNWISTLFLSEPLSQVETSFHLLVLFSSNEATFPIAFSDWPKSCWENCQHLRAGSWKEKWLAWGQASVELLTILIIVNVNEHLLSARTELSTLHAFLAWDSQQPLEGDFH